MVIEIIVFTLIIATFFNIILNKMNMPTIIGYILTGTIISYIFGFYQLADNNDLKIIGEFGIVFLMFTIGLEFSAKDLVQMKKNVFIYGSLQFFCISFVFYLISVFLFKIDSKESLIISLGLTLSSTAIVLKILKENGDINRNYGNRVLGILLFQDLMVIPILLLITILSTYDKTIVILLGKTIFAAVVLLIVMWVFGKYLLDYLLYRVAKTKSNEIFIGFIFFIIIGSSLVSHLLGFSYTLGAFIAGMLISETHYKHQIEADFIAFRDLLLGFFFITVGFQLDLGIIYNYIGTILVLFGWFIIVKFVVFYGLLRIFLNRGASLKTSIALFQFGEFGIVIFELASNNGLLGESLSHILIVIIILSMFITPIILKHIYQITDFYLGARNLDQDYCFLPNNLNNHIVLIGYSRLGKLLGNMIEKNNLEYVIIENDIRIYKKAKKEGKPIIYGNAHQTSTLDHLNINKAKTIIITIGEKQGLFLVAGVISKLNLKGKIIAKATDYREEKMLANLSISEVIVEAERTASSMFKRI
ncbi:MAG: cation:proton antiporter [Candidatus Gracilibacteria bacterium]|nr:cation:proton antiporter [Candidatus Gracilibacteria bacterium]